MDARFTAWVVLVAVGLVSLLPIRGARAEEPSPANALAELEAAVTRVAENATKSVVLVHVERRFVRASRAQSLVTSVERHVATGIIWDSDGHVVTLGRRLEGAARISIVAAGERVVHARLVGADPATGIALLVADGLANLGPLARADDSPRQGAFVVQIGSTDGFRASVSLGVVAGVDRAMTIERGGPLEHLVQTTITSRPGDAGAALVDLRGRLIGVTTPLSQPEPADDGLADWVKQLVGGRPGGLRPAIAPSPFTVDASRVAAAPGLALPMARVTEVVARLRREGSAERGWLGVQVVAIDVEIQQQLGLATATGVLIVEVTPDGPAAKAGLAPRDVVLTYGGAPIADMWAFRTRVIESAPGTSVEIGLQRGFESFRLEVVPARRPAE